jgi:DNA-binding transcriptional ArsR family regulator
VFDRPDSAPAAERDLGALAGLIGDATRMGILAALAEGVSLPAGELARRTGVRPATVTGHLRRLVDGGLVSVRAQGRHRERQSAPERQGPLEDVQRGLVPAGPGLLPALLQQVAEGRRVDGIAGERQPVAAGAGQHGVRAAERGAQPGDQGLQRVRRVGRRRPGRPRRSARRPRPAPGRPPRAG